MSRSPRITATHQRSLVLAAAALVAFAPAVVAQTTTTLDLTPKWQSTDAPSLTFLPGVGGDQRTQFLIGASYLKACAGKKILGIVFRRDRGQVEARPGGEVAMKVNLSTTARSTGAPSVVFKDNQGSNAALIFSGPVAIPKSRAVTAQTDPWAIENVVAITFTKPFVYQGNTLCIDIEGRATSTSADLFWPIDSDLSQSNGAAKSIGVACEHPSGWDTFADEATLCVGSTARVVSLGKPGSRSLALLGLQVYPAGLSLEGLGAKGCFQYVEPIWLVPMLFQPPVHAGLPGYANLSVTVPVLQPLMGANVFVQFADDETALPRSEWTTAAGLTAGNALQLTISSRARTIDMSTVASPIVSSTQSLPAAGAADTGLAPVIRLLVAQ